MLVDSEAFRKIGSENEVCPTGQSSSPTLCPEKIGTRLVNVRKNVRDRTQPAFAAEIGIAEEMLGNYERGKRLPTAEVIYALYTRARVNPIWLLTGEGLQCADEQATDVNLNQQDSLGAWIPEFQRFLANKFWSEFLE